MAARGLTLTLIASSLFVATAGSGLAQDPLRLLKHFEFGRSRVHWNSMDVQVRAKTNRERRAAEQVLVLQLLDVLALRRRLGQ